MPTIWISNDGGHSYHLANQVTGLEEADIKPLTVDNVQLLATDRLLRHLARGIVKYVKPEDWLIVSGSPILVGNIQTLWMLYHGRINLLLWNSRIQQYIQRSIELTDIRREFERLEWQPS